MLNTKSVPSSSRYQTPLPSTNQSTERTWRLHPYLAQHHLGVGHDLQAFDAQSKYDSLSLINYTFEEL